VLAGVRNVACGAAIVMAGLLAMILANSVWIALFRLEAVILFIPIPPVWYFDPWTSAVMWSRTDSLIGIAAMTLISAASAGKRNHQAEYCRSCQQAHVQGHPVHIGQR